MTLLIAEHNLPMLENLVDEYVLLNGQGSIVWRGAEPVPNDAPQIDSWPAQSSGPAVLKAEQLGLDRLDGPLFDHVDISLRAGQCLHLVGPNGVGKSSLLRCLAGLMRPHRGRLLLEGKELPRPGKALGRVCLLSQNPARQLFEDSVAAEVGFSLKRMGLGRDEISQRTEEALDICEALHLIDRPPLTLSFGEQHRVALAAALAPRPRVLLCDEPLTGLDLSQRKRVLAALAKFGLQNASALLIASHDPLPQPGWANEYMHLEEGRLAAV